MYYVIAKYKSKYGLIVYVTKVSDTDSFSVDLNNCYINTFYLKGTTDVDLNKVYSFQTVKGENGLTYAFL